MAGGALGSLINRKALANSPQEILNWKVFALSFVISFSGGLHGANTSNISGILAMPNFVSMFGFSAMTTDEQSNIRGWITSVIVLSGLVGALTSAPFNDRLGRRWTLWGTGVIYIAGSIVQLLASGNVNQVIGGRAMQGLASGVGTVTGTMFLAEIAPTAIRGVLGAFFSANIMLGVALGYWSNYMSIEHISTASPWSWRVPVLIQMYPGIILVLALPFAPESPRWLVVHDKTDAARKVLCRLRNLDPTHPFIADELGDLSRSIEAEAKDANSSTWMGLVRELRADRTLLRRFILVMIVQLGFNFSGGNSITYYQTSILTTIGVSDKHGVYLFSGVYGLMKVLAVLFYAFVCSERFGRRRCLLIGSTINIVCVLWIAIYLGTLSGKNQAAGWVAVAAICIFAIGYGIGWAPVAFGLNGELFPNQLRAKVMSLTIGLQYLANFCLTRFFPNMVLSIGSYGPFAIFAVVSTAITIYVFFALPETKGVAIEHMGELFGGRWFLNGIRRRSTAQVDDTCTAQDMGFDLEKAQKEHVDTKV